MKKSLLILCCLGYISCLKAQLLPPPEFYVGPRFNRFSVGTQDDRYSSTLQQLPSVGLAAGLQFASAERIGVPIYMSFELSVLRQGVRHQFQGVDFLRTADYNLQQLNLVFPVRWFLLHRQKDPLKAYVQAGIGFQVLNHGQGFTEIVRQVETAPGVLEEEKELVNLDRRINAFRFTSFPVEGGFIYYPGKGNYGVGISGGMLLPEITKRDSGLGYTNAWLAITFNALLERPDAFGF